MISTKAGYDMWPGPMASGARGGFLASLDQSLRRMSLEYVDIFYSHRPDPETPVEETMGALEARYVRARRSTPASPTTTPGRPPAPSPCSRTGHALPDSPMKYSMFVRTPEEGLLDKLSEEGVGGIAFSPLAQGLLTDAIWRASRPVRALPNRARS